MDGFPSGQRGQTVNLLQIASVVRIHLHPLQQGINRKVCPLFAYIGRVKWSYTDTGCLHTGNCVGTFDEQRERGMPKAFRVCLYAHDIGGNQ